jgi:hypothetical protein
MEPRRREAQPPTPIDRVAVSLIGITGLQILRLVVVRHITARCSYSGSAAGFPLQVERCDCASAPLRQRPPVRLLRQFHPHHIET